MNLPEFTKLPGAIAIDLDGTLLNSHSQLSDRNRLALEKCIELGIPIIIATSRPARIFKRIFPPELAEKCSLIIMNGALAVGKSPLNGRIKQTLPEKTIRDIVTVAQQYDPQVRITIEIEGFEFGTNWQGDKEILWLRNSATPDMVCSLDEAIVKNPCKIALGNIDIFPLAEILEEQFGKDISIIGAKYVSALANPILNITAKNATKPESLKSLLTPYGVSLHDVMAFGDDLPDLEMLQACGISVAMANAIPEIKSAAQYETASNDDDGVAVVLELMLNQCR
jgi:Cof subfamily protein (haloacid dehalogenase superfamily)